MPPLLDLRGPSDPWKYFDTVTGLDTTTSSGKVTNLSAIPQGASISNRVGDEIYLESIEFAMNIQFIVTAAGSASALRLILFQYYLDTSLASASASTVLQYTAQPYALASPFNMTNLRQENFGIIWEQLFPLAGNVNTANGVGNYGPTSTFIRKVFPIKRRLRYDAAATTGNGHLYLLAVTDSSTAGPTYSWVSRVNYSDVGK
jgi:hypothetical protein